MGRRIAAELLVVAGVGLALAALGPFGSYSVPAGPRTIYWMISMLAGYAIVRPLVSVSRWLSEQTGLGELAAQLLAMTLFMSRFFPDEHKKPPPAPPPAPDAAAPDRTRPRFLDRVPGTVGSPLLCLSMEDHYVRAHGPAGSALILIRMRDAVAELDGLPGLQVHRSWWVASDAVERVEKEDGRVRLRLVNGMTIPVARSQLGAVRSQRWPEA